MINQFLLRLFTHIESYFNLDDTLSLYAKINQIMYFDDKMCLWYLEPLDALVDFA